MRAPLWHHLKVNIDFDSSLGRWVFLKAGSPPVGAPFREAAMSSRPFPLPEDLGVKHARPAVYLWRCAAAYLRAGANRSGHLTPSGAARQLYGDGGRPTFKLIERTATVPASTTGTGWADVLAQQAVFDAVQQPTSLSASAVLIAHALHVSLDGLALVVIPGRTVTADAAGQWVGEAGAKPVRMLNLSSVTLAPRKLSVVTVFSREMAESSNVENIVKQTLSESAGLALDAAMFSPSATTARGLRGYCMA
jgi:hypothetical protein